MFKMSILHDDPGLNSLEVFKCFLSGFIIQCSAHAHNAFCILQLLVTKIDRIKRM